MKFLMEEMKQKSGIGMEPLGEEGRGEGDPTQQYASRPQTAPTQQSTPATSEEPNRRTVGRPTKARKLDRTNSQNVTVYVDKTNKRRLDLIKLENGLDIKDVMLAATVDFMDRYANGNSLTEAGKELVQRRINEILDRM